MINEYWKSTLNTDNKALYEKIYSSFKMFESDVSCGGTCTNDIITVYDAICNDHPELFYLSYAPRISQRVGLIGKNNTTLHIDFIYSLSEIKIYQEELNKLCQKLDHQFNGLSDKEKEKQICDFLIEKTNYKINNKFNQNAIAVLLKHEGQCSGIARAAKLLFDFLNIESMVVTGELIDKKSNKKEPHAWNIVRIDGAFFHLDVTSMIGCNKSKEPPFFYLFYNYSDEQLRESHEWDRKSAPICCGSYNNENRLTVNSLYELRLLIKTIDFSKTNSITFFNKIPCSDMDLLYDKIIQIAKENIKQIKKHARVKMKAAGQTVYLIFEDI